MADENLAKRQKKSGGTDEYLTPDSAVKPIVPYCIGKRVWTPFDMPDSAYVRVLSTNGISVIHSHIEEGKNFFDYEPPVSSYDCIISNPPFSQRDAVCERLFQIGKPFAMLLGFIGIFDSKKRFEMFKKNGIELLVLKGRVVYQNRLTGVRTSPMFNSVYLCHGMLPEKLIFSDV